MEYDRDQQTAVFAGTLTSVQIFVGCAETNAKDFRVVTIRRTDSSFHITAIATLGPFDLSPDDTRKIVTVDTSPLLTVDVFEYTGLLFLPHPIDSKATVQEFVFMTIF